MRDFIKVVAITLISLIYMLGGIVAFITSFMASCFAETNEERMLLGIVFISGLVLMICGRTLMN